MGVGLMLVVVRGREHLLLGRVVLLLRVLLLQLPQVLLLLLPLLRQRQRVVLAVTLLLLRVLLPMEVLGAQVAVGVSVAKEVRAVIVHQLLLQQAALSLLCQLHPRHGLRSVRHGSRPKPRPMRPPCAHYSTRLLTHAWRAPHSNPWCCMRPGVPG